MANETDTSFEKSIEKKKWRLKHINLADPHTSISHILMSHVTIAILLNPYFPLPLSL